MANYLYSSLININGSKDETQKTQVRMSTVGNSSDQYYPIGNFRSASSITTSAPYAQWLDYSDVEKDSVPTGFTQKVGSKNMKICAHRLYDAVPWTSTTTSSRQEWQATTEDANDTIFSDMSRPTINASSREDPGARVTSNQIGMSLFSGESLIFGPNLLGNPRDENENFNDLGYDWHPTSSGLLQSCAAKTNIYTYTNSKIGDTSVNNYNTIYNNASYFGWLAILAASNRNLHNEMILHLSLDESHYRSKTFKICTFDPYDSSGNYTVSSVQLEYEWVFVQLYGNQCNSLISSATYNTTDSNIGELYITDYFTDFFTVDSNPTSTPINSGTRARLSVGAAQTASNTCYLGYYDTNLNKYVTMPFKISASLDSSGNLTLTGQYIMFCYWGKLGLLMPRIRSIYRSASKTYYKWVTVTNTTTGINTSAANNFSLTNADYWGLSLNNWIYGGYILRNRSKSAVPGKLHFSLVNPDANYCYCITPQTSNSPTVFLCGSTYTNGYVDYYENLQPGSCVIGSNCPPGYKKLIDYYNDHKTSTSTMEKMWWFYDLNMGSSLKQTTTDFKGATLQVTLDSTKIFSINSIYSAFLHIYPGYVSSKRAHNTSGVDLYLDCNYMTDVDSKLGLAPSFKNSNGTTCSSGKLLWPKGGYIDVVVPSDSGSGSTSRTISCVPVLSNTYLKCNGQADSKYTFPTYSWTEKYATNTRVACNANYAVTHGWSCTFNATSIDVRTTTSNSFTADYSNYDWGQFYKNITCNMSFTPDSVGSADDLRSRYRYYLVINQGSSQKCSTYSSYFAKNGSQQSMSVSAVFQSELDIWIKATLYKYSLSSPSLSGSVRDAGSWKRYIKVYNPNPVSLRLYYTSNKTKSQTSANSNWSSYGALAAYGTTGDLTIQDQSGYDDEWIIAGFYLGYYISNRYLCTTWDEDVGTTSAKSSNWLYSR